MRLRANLKTAADSLIALPPSPLDDPDDGENDQSDEKYAATSCRASYNSHRGR
eukprot:m.30107 g.30107  ORF g.30107 m.30107 type:complete len:53 (-) comp40928_c0_seq1:53-211(-)